MLEMTNSSCEGKEEEVWPELVNINIHTSKAFTCSFSHTTDTNIEVDRKEIKYKIKLANFLLNAAAYFTVMRLVHIK